MARIKVDLDRTLGEVDRRIFGGFIEHLGRCIYGGIYEEGSPLSDERGFRRDVLEALKPLRMPVLRWPGGNFVSNYHWQDGIGPKEKRPRRIELAWHSEESNRFGTDEYIQYCRTLGVEPYICVNMGSGTMDEAQAWVEYCNGTGNTYWANLRRANGHSEPYNVKYWGLGNEMYGAWQIGALSAEDYVKKAIEFAKVMKLTDPSIQLVSCGQNGWNDWDRIVLEGLARYVDFHSIHLYTGSPDYYRNVFEPHLADKALRICQALIEQVRYNQRIAHPVYVAYDEWNVWYRQRGRTSGLEERYDLSDALAVATYLNVFVRHCQIVRIANLAQMVNVIAPIFTSQEGLFLQTIYHPLRLYAEHVQEIALDVHVDCERFELPPTDDPTPRAQRLQGFGPFDLLDVSATRDADGQTLTLAVVNRDRAQAIQTTVQLTDAHVTHGIAYVVDGPSPNAVNSFEQPKQVDVHSQSLEVSGSSVVHTFPAHSVTVLRLELGA
ncbi:MAG TPA: alpha-L-arabinofuranosidase C-terminal domain-containing protein [Chloroflexota bacterium]|nr:alpha-L-arabinofuranosidase C-terminal domain-containing protein [Chloroflexota bacterium]